MGQEELSREPREVTALIFDARWLHLAGEFGEVRLDLDRPTFAATGKLLVSSRALGAAIPSAIGGTTKVLSGRSAESISFVDLHVGAEGRLYRMTEKCLGSWDFLGERKTFSGRTNFLALCELLRARPGVVWDDTLVRNANALAAATETGRRGDATSSLSVYSRSTEAASVEMSCVLRARWIARARIAQEALAPEEALAAGPQVTA